MSEFWNLLTKGIVFEKKNVSGWIWNAKVVHRINYNRYAYNLIYSEKFLEKEDNP